MSRARAAVTAVFFLNGMVFGSWYSRLPSIQDDLGLGTGTLGLALLGAPVGLLIAQPLTGALAATVGSRRLVAASPLCWWRRWRPRWRSTPHAGARPRSRSVPPTGCSTCP